MLKKSQNGFTLVELLLATSITLVILTMSYGFHQRVRDFQQRMSNHHRLQIAAIEAWLLLTDGVTADLDNSGTVDPTSPADHMGGLRGASGWSGSGMEFWLYRDGLNKRSEVTMRSRFNTLNLLAGDNPTVGVSGMSSPRNVICSGPQQPHPDCETASATPIALGYLFNRTTGTNALLHTDYRVTDRTMAINLEMADPDHLIQSAAMNDSGYTAFHNLPPLLRLGLHGHVAMLGDYR
ncbi:MAG: prepilin-type N-terminal cleavage/methylation domain-containing protein [Magnetococcus sp. YQC-3]